MTGEPTPAGGYFFGGTVGIPRNGSFSAPKALDGTAGRSGFTGVSRWYAVPGAGRGSASPLLGQYDIARSAWAVIVREGLTPRLAEIAEPSTTEMPG
jgi:hypothetical protein